MANFSDHMEQVKSNLRFLGTINKCTNDHWDWQVTTCFYVGVHLFSAYFADKANLHYQSHKDTLKALNFQNAMSPYRVDQSTYLAYRSLFNLSIRSRYLSIHQDNMDKTKVHDEDRAFKTFSRHLHDAVKKTDALMLYIDNIYKVKFPVSNVDCIDLRGQQLNYFKYHQHTTQKTTVA